MSRPDDGVCGMVTDVIGPATRYNTDVQHNVLWMASAHD